MSCINNRAKYGKGITVRLGTASLGAIGLMSISNKSQCTLVNPKFCSADTGHDLFFRPEALRQTAPTRSFNLVLFPFRKNIFPDLCILWLEQQEN